MSLEYILLGLLREPSSGYDLKRIFDESIGHIWAAELSQIYPTLARLEQRGMVKSSDAVSKRGPARRVYQPTASGRKALRAWLAGAPQIGDERFAYLAQLFLMDELGDLQQTRGFLEQLRERVAARLEALRSIERRWAQADPRYPDALPSADFHVQLTLRKGLVSLQATVAWCDESLQRVKARMAAERPRPKRSKAARKSA